MSENVTVTVTVEEADFPTLKHHAEVNLGLEVKHGTNAATLRKAILNAAPGTVEIPALESAKAPAPAPMPEGVKYHINNPGLDPKVELSIAKTADPTRDKNWTVSVNGYTWRGQRGVRIELPYRAYRALENAIEKQAVLQDEEGPMGVPLYEYEEVYSYPFTVHRMPSDEEIAAWHKATCEAPLDEAA